MKQTLQVVILSLFLTSLSFGQQTAWGWVNPLPQGNILNSVLAINQDTVFSVGDYGTIIKTSNGGKTWQVTRTAAGVIEALYAVHFISPTTGWVVGEGGRILKTTDAGKSWFILSSPTYRDLYTIKFISSTTGWIAGQQGIILKTTDGGNSWILQSSGSTSSFYGIYFFDANTGWVTGTGGTALKTTNGGTTWVSKTTGTIQNLYSIQFASTSIGFAAGSFGVILRSSDAGESWTPQTTNTWLSFYSLQFTSALTGWAVGSYGIILKTTNSGFSWFEQTSNTYNDLFSAHFTSSTKGWAIGDFGTIVATTDGGTTWSGQSSNIKQALYAMSFASKSIGLAVGEEGVIIRTSDGGRSWTQYASGVMQTLYGAHMLSTDLGWAVGDSAVILKTTNGGGIWTEQNSHTDLSLYSIFFSSPSVGWAVGDYGMILTTTNGGTSWQAQTTEVTSPLMRVKFYNTSIGWAVGSDGEIIKTTNGGVTWIPQFSNTSGTLYAIDIIDVNTVVTSGDFGAVLWTTNGGTTWNSSTVEGWPSLYGVAFNTLSNGWAVGDDGTVVATTDGGTTWTYQNSGTYNTFWDIQLVRSGTAGGTLFSAGVGGTLICSGVSPLSAKLWTGQYDSLWTTAGNWSPSGVPGPGDSVIINASPVQPVHRGIMQDINIAYLGIGLGARLSIGSGLAQLVVSGTIKIDGTLQLDPNATLVVTAGSNLQLGALGTIIPGQSTIMINNSGQVRGPFFNLFIGTGATVQSIGNTDILNNITIHSNLSQRLNDTITINNPDPTGFQGDGIINGGTIKRAINPTATYAYRFESPFTSIMFYPTGTFPNTVLMTGYPHTNPPYLSDTAFVKRYYSIAALGGANYKSRLSLRYDTSETTIPIDEISIFRDSIGAIFNLGATDYLDSDYVAIILDSVSYFSTWYLGKSEYIWHHPLQFTDTLIVTDNGLASDTLLFGTAPGATNGIDGVWEEFLLPAAPPSGTFDARWSIQATNGTDRDIRDILSNTHQQNIYYCHLQPGPGGYPISLKWDSTLFPFGSILLRDSITHGGKFSIDMRTAGVYTVTDPTVASIEIVNTAPAYYSFNQGWNMVSIPVNPWNSNKKISIFPEAISEAFGYRLGYYASDTLTPGIGYWLKLPAQQIIPIDGVPLTADTITIHDGWNMIGSIATPVPTSHIIEQPSGLVRSSYFKYNLGYTVSDTIAPSHAYWVKANQSGTLILSQGTIASGNQITKSPVEIPDKLITITLSDATQSQQELYITSDTQFSAAPDFFELPPRAPEGIFDARFASNNQLEYISDASRATIIQLHSCSYPVTVHWDANDPNIQQIRFANATSKATLMYTSGLQAGSFQIADPAVTAIAITAEDKTTLPTSYALKQNYPNPFNPTTVIEYMVPEAAIVTLKVYDILGREVATLLDQSRVEAGIHQLEFQCGSITSSGIYFYKIHAQGSQRLFTDIKKMALVK
jgi:photosystem II stability/assembly factor-like uncharacterized protein